MKRGWRQPAAQPWGPSSVSSALPVASQSSQMAPGATRPAWRRLAIGAIALIAATVGWWVGRSRVRPVSVDTATRPAVTLTPLTSDPGFEGEPTFSPDGQTIAFVSDRTGDYEIFLRQVSGGPSLNLTNNPADDVQPAFSPDGRQIAFVSSRTGTSDVLYGQPDVPLLGGDIWVMPALGGSPRRIVDKGNFPSWSRDSKSLLYTAGPWFGQRIYQVSASGGTPRAIPIAFPPDGADLQPAISGDGKLVAFAAVEVFSNIERLPFDATSGRQTGGATPVTAGKDPIYFFSSAPDGSAVSFALARHVWRSATDGSAQQLTADPQFEDSAPRWSPDGQTIAFVRRATRQGGPSGIWIMEADGGNPRPILDTAGLTGLFAWTSEGRRVVHVSPRDRQLYVTDLSAKASRRLTNEPGVMPIIATSRDGRWAVYQSVQSGDVDLYAVPLDGGVSRPVVTTTHKDYHPSLSPTGQWLYYLHDHRALYRVPGPSQNWHQALPEKMIDFRLQSGAFVEDPQIAPDGRSLLYARGRFSGDLWIASLER